MENLLNKLFKIVYTEDDEKMRNITLEEFGFGKDHPEINDINNLENLWMYNGAIPKTHFQTLMRRHYWNDLVKSHTRYLHSIALTVLVGVLSFFLSYPILFVGGCLFGLGVFLTFLFRFTMKINNKSYYANIAIEDIYHDIGENDQQLRNADGSYSDWIKNITKELENS